MSESVRTGSGSTGEKVKAETTATAGQAKQAAGQVAGTAAEQARAVVGEARDQAGTVVQDLRARAVEEADGQTRRAAGTLRQWATDLTELAAHAESDSPARSLAARAGDGGQRAADYLERQGVEGLVTDLQSFARRRPGAFLGGALLAGLAVGRLAKVTQAASQANGNGRAQVDAAPGQGEVAPPVGTTPAMTPPPAPSAPPSLGTPPAGTPGRTFPEA
ncbi:MULTISPECIES: hypothetical protein [Streptomyces]|uniref:DUF3618 domain-containing protein n=1 Tax=Streptomyces tendae TaxID=1932 RepID=A0ABX5ZVE0_STRTE|nr:hypothetical protein [Streptomyces tendae]QER88642.1 hypothetical protein F3L20_24785 [Streptomyces tendae]